MKCESLVVGRSCRNGQNSKNMREEMTNRFICMEVDLDLVPEPDYRRHLSSDPISVNSQSHTDTLEREQTSEAFNVS